MQIRQQTKHAYTWDRFSLDKLQERSYWVFDVEATGINTDTEHVTQIGAVEVVAGQLNEAWVFSSYVRSPKPIPEKIQALTGVRQQDSEKAPEFTAVFREFVARGDNHTLVTQCGYEFDYPILQAECERNGLAFPGSPRLDTKAVFAFLHPELDDIFSTDYLLNYYGIDAGGFKRHDALGDALIIGLIWCAELKEATRQGVDAISVTAPVAIRSFVLPPL